MLKHLYLLISNLKIDLKLSDGQIDCGPEAEDEEDCELTEDMIKKIKNECEANTLSRHVMCPNTYICIKQDWLCGELESAFDIRDVEKRGNFDYFSDGDDDCNDFTDETHCGTKTNCSEDQFECMNGLCVPQEWICGKNASNSSDNSDNKFDIDFRWR